MLLIDTRLLRAGDNQFDWVLDPGALNWDGADVEIVDPIEVKLTVTKLDDELIFAGHVQTMLNLKCVRCLGDVKRPVSESFDLFFRKQSAIAEESLPELAKDDCLEVLYRENIIDFSEHVRETILLSLPIKILCEDNCLGLCPQCGQNLNRGLCECEDTVIDPRWEMLATLKIS